MGLRDDEWSRTWKLVPAERRRRIARAVLRGRAVADPRDAPLALELIERRAERLRRAQKTWFWNVLSTRHLVVFGVIGVIGGLLARDALLIAMAALIPLYLIGVRTFLRRLHDNIVSARENNERLVG